MGRYRRFISILSFRRGTFLTLLAMVHSAEIRLTEVLLGLVMIGLRMLIRAGSGEGGAVIVDVDEKAGETGRSISICKIDMMICQDSY